MRMRCEENAERCATDKLLLCSAGLGASWSLHRGPLFENSVTFGPRAQSSVIASELVIVEHRSL